MPDNAHKLNVHSETVHNDRFYNDRFYNDRFYNDNAEQLAGQYLSTSFEQVHASWSSHLNLMLARNMCLLTVLDVGAGAGRDAYYLAQQSHSFTSSALNEQGQHVIMQQHVEVVAVEPAQQLADLGKQHTQGCNVTWIDDRLPELHRLAIYQHGFNLILLSAVWMHIPPDERITALQSLEYLLAPHGKLIISLRHGTNDHNNSNNNSDSSSNNSHSTRADNGRVMYPVSVDALQDVASQAHLVIIDATERESDKLGRPQVFWQTVILQRIQDVNASHGMMNTAL
ncbi:class I SAM-dependent methyltransferase [Shewanella sp. VB17]|uniref:class I SAM-dependent methyltransferase n=1 Tax=Shewanella sp. VB17 TaxID=2739432 RepID=UPI001565BEC4|nr:class I SAM-dependent methyltransferase [Shewanella sp. VB17]NRD74002.1 class I SAM-dependent methyltransferase [Shewanella sp. VB17]